MRGAEGRSADGQPYSSENYHNEHKQSGVDKKVQPLLNINRSERVDELAYDQQSNYLKGEEHLEVGS